MRGPTFSLRIRRSQSSRWLSLRRICVVSANAVVPAPVGGSMAVRSAPGYGVGKGRLIDSYAPAPIFGSVPAISRAIFARWVIHTTTASTANSAAGAP